MGIIISIVTFLISAYITYCLFQKYGFKAAWAVTFCIEIIGTFIQNKASLAGATIIFAILFVAITSLITTGLEYFVFKRSNSFGGYVGGLFLMGLVVALILVVIGVIIGMIIGSSGILAL